MTTRIVYQDELVTEYEDGTEVVRFTDAEWAQMASDPAFGIVCRSGHPIDRAYYDGSGECWACVVEREMES